MEKMNKLLDSIKEGNCRTHLDASGVVTHWWNFSIHWEWVENSKVILSVWTSSRGQPSMKVLRIQSHSCGRGEKESKFKYCVTVQWAHTGRLILLSLTPELLPSCPTLLPKETWDGGMIFMNDWHSLHSTRHWHACKTETAWMDVSKLVWDVSNGNFWLQHASPARLHSLTFSHISLLFWGSTQSFQAAHALFRGRPARVGEGRLEALS